MLLIMKIAFFIILTTCIAMPVNTSTLSVVSEGKATIVLDIKGIRNSIGLIQVSIFSSKNGFPSDPALAIENLSLRATAPSLKTTIKGLKPGNYAISVIHDENSDSQLNTNFFGIPVEGFGSTGKNRKYSPPLFDQSVFAVKEGLNAVEITLNYLLN